ncbi:MAG: ATP-binding protein [Brevundimonas sp.]
MSQGVAFGVVLLAPEPRPAGFSLQQAAAALQGKPAETSDGRTLKRRMTDEPVLPGREDQIDPIALAITAGLAQQLGVQPEAVRVAVDHGPQPRRRPGPTNESGDGLSFVFVRGGETVPGGPPPPPGKVLREQIEGKVIIRESATTQSEVHMRHVPREQIETTLNRRNLPEGAVVRVAPGGGAQVQPLVVDTTTRHFTLQADRVTFAPFAASVQQADGRWATVEPPKGLLSPWQQRVLLALVISMLLLAPLVWWMARRLTRPIRVFAEAAERLGADPDAEPLEPSGPSEVRTAIAAFNDMQASLRAHMRQRAQTIAAIAHDLRTPLTRLRFRAEQSPDSVRDRMAADIEEMDALIAQAMAFVRGETTPERREVFDLDALAAACADGFIETGAAVTFDGGGELPVRADPAALRRALGNLIGNAVKYAGAARVMAFAEGGQAVVLVEDEGPGLPDDELEAVFEPFRRGERSRNRETGGAGLGLTVARQAARAHGGDVVLANREGGGLAARLTLPLA